MHIRQEFREDTTCRILNYLEMVKTALSTSRVRPTSYQIDAGLVVVPSEFVKLNRGQINWTAFTAVFFGERLLRKIDQDNRIRLPLKGRISAGDVFELSIFGGELVITKLD